MKTLCSVNGTFGLSIFTAAAWLGRVLVVGSVCVAVRAPGTVPTGGTDADH